MNNVKTMVLMAGLMGLFLLAGQLLGGSQGLVLALVLGSAFNFIMYFFSDKIVLRMYGAQIVSEEQAPELYRMVDRLRQRAGLPMPVVAVAPHEQPNAFATGRNPEHAVVAVTTGILKYMPQEELEGVIAHELAHVKNRDMLITTLAAGVAGAISNLPYLLLFGGGRSDEDGHPIAQLALLLLAPIGAMLIQFAVSRQREFEADRVGAEILGPADAAGQRAPPARRHGPADPDAGGSGRRAARAGEPARGPRRRCAGLFSTHPPTEERVARLEAMAVRAGRWAITAWPSGWASPGS